MNLDIHHEEPNNRQSIFFENKRNENLYSKNKNPAKKSICELTPQDINLNLRPHSHLMPLEPEYKEELTLKDTRSYYKFQNVFDSCDEKEREMDREPLFLIEINSKFQTCWEYFMLFTIVYSAFWSPFNLCFSNESVINEAIEILIEIALIIDIFLAFHTQIEDHTETIHSSSKIITYSYLKGWFFLDVITCFPVSVIQIFDRENQLLIYLKWFGLVRLLKLVKYPFLINKMMVDNERLDKLIKNFIFLVIMLHTLSCFFIFIGLHNQSNANWISYHNIQRTDDWSIYIGSLTFHLLSIFTIGFGGIEAVNFGERVYSNCIFMIIILLFPYIIISISKVLAEDDPAQIIFYSKLSRLGKVNKKLNLGKVLKNKISQALKLENDKKFNERFNFFEFLPINARHLLNSFIYNNTVKSMKFFQDQSYEFILFTFPYLRHFNLKKGHYLYNIGEKVDEMFLVLKGSLSVDLGQEYSNLELTVLGKNSYFGDIFLFTNKISPFNCKVKSDKTQVFMINSEDYILMKTKYPKNILNIMEKSSENLNFLNERKRNLINLLKQEKTKENVVLKLRLINAYLLERDFDDYFYNNVEIENLNHFLINNPFKNVKSAIEKMLANRKNNRYLSVKFNSPSKNLFKNILNNINKSYLYGNNISINSFQENEKKRFSNYNKFSPNFKNSDLRKLDTYDKECFDKNVNKLLNRKESDSQNISRNSKGKNSFFLNSSNQNIQNKANSINNLNKSKASIFLSPTPKVETIRIKENKKIKFRRKYNELLNDIYSINFEQELDMDSLQKEKEIGIKTSEIIIANQKKLEIDDNTITKKLSIKNSFEHRDKKLMQIKSMYSMENLMSNQGTIIGVNNLMIINESSFSCISKKKTKNIIIHSFKNLKKVPIESMTISKKSSPLITRKSHAKIKYHDPEIDKKHQLDHDIFSALKDPEFIINKTKRKTTMKSVSPKKSFTRELKKGQKSFLVQEFKYLNVTKTMNKNINIELVHQKVDKILDLLKIRINDDSS